MHIKLQFFNELRGELLGSARTGFGAGNALGAEIPIQRIDSRVQNEVAVGAGFQVALDLALDGRGEATL